MRSSALGLVFLLSACSVLFGQSASVSQISGTVQDSTGSAIPGAQIRVTQTETGLTRTTVSGSDGAYVLPSLPIGPYRMDISKEGFTTYVQTGIVLQVDTNPKIDAILEIGSVSEQIQVEAAAAMVESHSTGIGQVVDQERVVDLPLNGREVTQLVTLAGAATTIATFANLNSAKNYPNEQIISVAGGALNGLTYLLDGASHNDPFNNANLPLPFPDALQEFKVETSALPAQYGQHSAGAVNAVTKSGSNEFHGDAFEFVRNYDFNARDFFAPVRDSLKRNQVGGTFGGPIRKNKLFFFLGFQATIQSSAPATSFAYEPTPQMLTGDFSTITSPACNSGRQITLKNPATGQPFPNNFIPPSSFNASALKMLTYFPTPTDPCGKVQYGLLNNQTENMGMAKIDYQISANHSFFGRYYVTHSLVPPSYSGTILSIVTAGTDDEVNSLVLGDTYVLGPGTLNSFRATLNRSAIHKFEVPYFNPTDLGINITDLEANLTDITINNAFTSYGGTAAPGLIFTTSTQFADDMSLIRGSHQIQFGVNWIRPIQNTSFYVEPNGAFSFNGSFTNLSMADFLLGDVSSFAQGPVTHDLEHLNSFALYAQDSWKLSPHLTVNYGLRWEPYIPPYSMAGLRISILRCSLRTCIRRYTPMLRLAPFSPVTRASTLITGRTTSHGRISSPGLAWSGTRRAMDA